jgi:hypothetical protein
LEGIAFAHLGWSSLQMMRLVQELSESGQPTSIRSLVSSEDARDWEENSLQISKEEKQESLPSEIMDDILSILNQDGED